MKPQQNNLQKLNVELKSRDGSSPKNSKGIHNLGRKMTVPVSIDKIEHKSCNCRPSKPGGKVALLKMTTCRGYYGYISIRIMSVFVKEQRAFHPRALF